MKALIFILAIIAPAPVATPESPTQARDLAPLTIGENVFHRRVLANGLRAVAVRDQEAHVSVFVVVGVGKRQETAGTTGLAHLVEHAMYTGTPTTGVDEHERIVESWGGKSNAYTREDYTLYYDHAFPAEKLLELLKMEADRLRNLTFAEEPVLHERHRLEVEEANTFQPSEGRAEQLEDAVFRAHSYRVGLRDEKGHTKAPQLPVAAIKEFYDRHYHPDNVCIVVAGGVEPAKALDDVEAAFGKIPAGPKQAPPTVEPWPEKSRTVRIPSTLPRDRHELVWLIPERGDPARWALQVLGDCIDRRELPGGRPIEVAVGERVDCDLFVVSTTGEGGVEALRGVLEQFRAEAPAAEELAEVKRLSQKRYDGRPLRARPYFALAGTFGIYEVFGQAELLAHHHREIAAVTGEEVLEAARRYLAPARCVTVVFEGTGAEIAPLPTDPEALRTAAAEAADSGDYQRAIEAYTRLLAMKPNRMNTVIYLATRGQVHLELRAFDAAIADFEEALAVVDYPAVRDLLEEALTRKEAAMRGEFGDGEK